MFKNPSYFSSLKASKSVCSFYGFYQKSVLLWLLTLIFSCRYTQNVSQEKAVFSKEFLLKKYQNFHSIFNNKFEKMKVKDNSNGLFAWGLSYLTESYLEMYELTGDSTYLKRGPNTLGSS